MNAHFELRDIAEIKLFFNELAGLDDVAARMVTLELGLGLEQAALKFWHGVAEQVARGEFPPSSPRTTRRTKAV
ncbi:hypothetical protein JOF56_009443 [Kibdelosporangium banguiense]|uniref:Uncharacterized protein n=1 Tax=Kibdelosporangium banguiense TaxID=1365924 RepID=A0ABS4TXC1_9PSEU|nr:hypothetical protein [Kibdelosporangium banguiense]MBP2329058.1 hypothetical protein [Kibdelosporangium banguiense]